MIHWLRFAALTGILLAAACAPARESTPPQMSPVTLPAPAGTNTATPTLTLEAPTVTAASSPLPQATSRGPNLEATDPLTVSLASGRLQLVEFFRFT